ncbi:hypothetical protein OB2597_13588 [Pseudooceanicola batsensis HTCC2597]|uniref:2-dehydro-3-deoxygalactonokinase n=1 Tax=Pseudooceanicola batsensis (strain ATCC BAA-863 / DSM 15984 / KCTC 12145 / HTCC2597) TaxID=252305 RepID=A3TYE6_PSEBH|nr:2-dehydro-3-deoxygalactonokinase [Pseudooceanicola batsensis]EAQ03180.1 hypothetical protein OB2597_13588 [Pseudooceanicola batsensis HTCC2597]
MSWQGRISGSDGVWGDAQPDLVILVSGEASGADRVPARLIPESPRTGDNALMLPGLGGLSGRERLILIGFQALNPHWDGVAVVVGETAAHWVTLSAGEVIHAQGSLAPAMARALGAAEAAAQGLDEALDRPERLPLLLHDAATDGARLGALLGADVGATRTLWLGQQAVLVGSGPLAKGYIAALSAAHVPVTLTDSGALIQKGFAALAARWSPQAD